MKKLQGMSFFWQLCMLFHMEYLTFLLSHLLSIILSIYWTFFSLH